VRSKRTLVIGIVLWVTFAGLISFQILWNLNINGIGPQWATLDKRQSQRARMLEHVRDQIWQYANNKKIQPAHFNDIAKWRPELMQELEDMNPSGTMIIHINFAPLESGPSQSPLPIVTYDAPDEEHIILNKP